MLDAYIIERIRREREDHRERNILPLRIERPPPPPPLPDPREESEPSPRGSDVIDFRL